jgi:hypothetical protein
MPPILLTMTLLSALPVAAPPEAAGDRSRSS